MTPWPLKIAGFESLISTELFRMTPSASNFKTVAKNSALGILFTLVLSFTVSAQTLRVGTELLSASFSDASSLGNLSAGVKVELLQSKGAWAQIRTNGKTGWVRMALLEGVSAQLAKTALVDNGRKQSGNIVATSGIRSASFRSNRHAFIIGVGEYSLPNVPALLGVKSDVESAKVMAEYMGVPKENITVLQNTQATQSKITEELTALNERVRPGDRVFIYYSGHGSRWMDVQDKGQCVEALLPADGKPLTNGMMAALLNPIGQKTDKMIVFYDACHSGGVVTEPTKTRSIKIGNDVLKPKFSASAGADVCAVPVNMKTRSVVGEVKKSGVLTENIVSIMSSRNNEVSFDDANKGGLATQYFRDCMISDGKDRDGSGGLSVAEVVECAQVKINKRLENSSDLLAPHMLVAGNKDFVPALFKMPFATPDKQTETVVLVVPTPVAAVIEQPKPIFEDIPASIAAEVAAESQTTQTALMTATPPATSPSEPIKPAQMDPTAIFADAVAQANGMIKVKVNIEKPLLRIGKDPLDFQVTSNIDGYVYVVLLGSDKKSYYMLFPNEVDGKNSIQANVPLRLPRASWRITAQGPAGVNELLVVVTESPRDMTQLKAKADGPFLSSLTDEQGSANLQWLIGTSANADSKDCNTGNKTRNLAITKVCSDSYGAARRKVIEK